MELFYSIGGHGGPYPTLELARKGARRIIFGSLNENLRIKIRASSTATEVIESWGRDRRSGHVRREV
jgi:hypothetical protein